MKVVKVFRAASCPACLRARGVNNDGTLRWHTVGGRFDERCPGSRERVDAPVIDGLW